MRIAAYKLLSAAKDAFHFRINKHLDCSHGKYPPHVAMVTPPNTLSSLLSPFLPELCIPTNSAQFVVSISEALAGTETHLTVEFLSEVVAGFQHYTPSHKQLCLAYISPWIPNLAHFVHNDPSPEQEKVIRLIDLLVALTISETEVMGTLFASNIRCEVVCVCVCVCVCVRVCVCVCVCACVCVHCTHAD